ncbi:kinase-like protein [Hypomontagnella monticulosa]|nr:kinase-like protein [Hypomontagnella monticulosa]
MPMDLSIPNNYAVERRTEWTTPPGIAAIRGNSPPNILVTQATETEGTRKERDSERSSVIQDLGRELRLEYSSQSETHTGTPRTYSDLTNILRGISGGRRHKKIEHLLYDSEVLVPDEYGGGEFIPQNVQEDIITHAPVREELMHVGLGRRLDNVVNYVCGGPGRRKDEIGRQIFAILTLIQKQGSIGAFEKAGIYDNSLPFRKSTGTHDDYQLVTNTLTGNRNLETLGCLEGWEPRHKRRFLECQWRFLSPFFGRKQGEPPLFYPLESKIVLPWKNCGPDVDETGGHSEVRKIQIHEAHHGFEKEKGNWFALKVLYSHSKHDFDAEFGALKKVKPHAHLVPVLAAFNHRDRYYLLFPWANGGNLTMFWNRYPEPPTPKPILWFAQQCYGLATALHHIHDISMSSLTVGNNASTGQLNGGAVERPFGRHGDIKPENVLQFRDGGSEMGNLKISDFGLTIFHSAKSKSRDRLDPWAMALTYNPPETIKNTNISRRYDIWGLGCLYLDFLTWLFLGFKGVDEFSMTRMKEQGVDKRKWFDQFFKDRKRRSDRYPVVKTSVKNHIKNLQGRDDCSDFLFDFLEIIKTCMLVADEKKRIECRDLKVKLENLVEKCCDETYLSLRSPKATSPKTGDASTTYQDSTFVKTYLLRKRPSDQEDDTANSQGKRPRRMNSGIG